MAEKGIQVLLVTANVGSIFEDPSVMLKIWTEEFLQTVDRLDPKFIAIHCQEVGGKNYERSMKHVEYFVRLLMTSEELRLFDKVRVYLDEDFSSAENFTALGNLYFIHETVSDALIWDFATMNFVSASGKEVHSGNIEAVTTKEKAKFPQDFFPECKWSRKGFLRTRWSLNGTVFDLINIHLFHDASNFLAMESFPSVYCKNRRRALEHTLERFHNDGYETAPFFVFGDFNFRTDTRGVVAKLSEGLNQVRVQSSKADQTRMQYHDENSQVILSVGKKEFSHSQHENIFTGDDGIWLKEFDRELDSFSGSLYEFPITFPPSYPFEEDENGAKSYMKTRCPAWCDRVLLANTATSLVNNLSDHSCVEYGIMGSSTCMGDHKPVYLKLDLVTNAGTVCCCPTPRGSTLGVMFCLNGLSRSPVLDTLTLPRLPSYAREPYTPESMDTPSPIPSPTPGDARQRHKSFNDCVAARLRQQTENLQGDQGPLTQRSNDADWTHCQSSEPAPDDGYSDFNANTRLDVASMLCDNVKPLLHSPMVLVTQFAQTNSHCPGLERYLNKPSEPGSFDLSLDVGGKTETTEIPPSDYDKGEVLPSKKGEEKENRNLNNRVSLRESLPEGVRDAMEGKQKKSPRTFVKCTQSRSAVEMKVSTLDKMDAGSDGMRTGRCFSDASWLRRTAVDKPLSRVRLISGCESLTRLHSHHSSSDEDWFEEVHETLRDDVNVNETAEDIPDVCALLYAGLSDDTSTDDASSLTDTPRPHSPGPPTSPKCEGARSLKEAHSPGPTSSLKEAHSPGPTSSLKEAYWPGLLASPKCGDASSLTQAHSPGPASSLKEAYWPGLLASPKCERASSQTDVSQAHSPGPTSPKCGNASSLTQAHSPGPASRLTEGHSPGPASRLTGSYSPGPTSPKCDDGTGRTEAQRSHSPDDESTTSLMAYFREQSVALSDESPPASVSEDTLERAKEKPQARCNKCCTIL